jgi:cytochrome c556
MGAKPMSNQIRFLTTILSGTVLSLGLAALSCQPKPRPAAVTEAGVHAVHSEKLEALMDELDKPTDRLPKELDVEGERQQKIARVQSLAHEMAVAADRIPDVLEGVEISEDQRKVFIGLATKLEEQARSLEQQAKEGDLSSVSKTREEIAETCDFCHRRFRILPAIQEEP